VTVIFFQFEFRLNFGLIEACAANHNFQPTVVGGDGNDVQICERQASSEFLSFDSRIFSLCWFLARSE
jgi:hypothetical protein